MWRNTVNAIIFWTLCVVGSALRTELTARRLSSARRLRAPDDPPDFYACDRKACKGDDPRQVYMLDILSYSVPKARNITNSGARPVVLQIGIDSLDNISPFCDVDLYNKLGSMQPLRNFRAVLVDPSKSKNARTRQNVRQTPLDPKKTQILNAMVMDKCDAKYMHMYGFSTKMVTRDFGLQCVVYNGWISAEKMGPVNALRIVGADLEANLPRPCQGEAEKWTAFVNAPNVLDYIETYTYPCMTPSDVLAAAHVSASNLAGVIIDAERMDTYIVSAFLKEPGFKPGYLQFEGEWPDDDSSATDADYSATIQELRKRGYKVGTNIVTSTADAAAGEYASDTGNILAVLPHPGADETMEETATQ